MPRCIVSAEEEATGARPYREPDFVYELAVKSFSIRHPAVPEPIRGTLAALRQDEIIAHLQRLGVSHVELMPVAAWIDERHLPPLGLHNAWGYNPVNFFALDPRLAPDGFAGLSALTRRFAEAGIDIIVDVVFNHTGESDEQGPTLCLRGLDNAVYYRHDAEGRLVNDTGCGNTLALDRPPVWRMAMDALRRLRRCGVAGFRFDLAPVLGRVGEGGFSPEAPLLAAMAQDPELADCLLIAEPWDVGPGGYQLGAFPPPFREWNGRYRDDVRRFWRGDPGVMGALTTRLAGSSDLFAQGRRPPDSGVNFVAIHDGFTLADVVSYAEKHNQANGEDNRDGTGENFSWNCGCEGPTDDAAIRAARSADVRALLATLFVSRGVPMIQAGDEFGRTQGGNNNGYAQDTEAFWLDWANADQTLIAFAAALSKLRRDWPVLRADQFYTGLPLAGTADPDVLWLDSDSRPLSGTAWDSADVLGMLLGPCRRPERLLVAINRRQQPAPFQLPPSEASAGWQLILQSADVPPTLAAASVVLPARSVCILAEQAPGP